MDERSVGLNCVNSTMRQPPNWREAEEDWGRCREADRYNPSRVRPTMSSHWASSIPLRCESRQGSLRCGTAIRSMAGGSILCRRGGPPCPQPFTVRIDVKAGIFQSGHHRPVIWPTTNLAAHQRQNGSHSEREPCQNEYDSAGWRCHGK